MSELAAGLDPSAYLAFSARLASGVGDPKQLRVQANSLLASVQVGDYTLLIRHAAALVASAQMAAHKAVQNALQCDDPAQFKRWMIASEEAQKLVTQATQQMNTVVAQQQLAAPGRAKISARIMEYAVEQAKALLEAEQPVTSWSPVLIESDIPTE